MSWGVKGMCGGLGARYACQIGVDPGRVEQLLQQHALVVLHGQAVLFLLDPLLLFWTGAHGGKRGTLVRRD